MEGLFGRLSSRRLAQHGCEMVRTHDPFLPAGLDEIVAEGPVAQTHRLLQALVDGIASKLLTTLGKVTTRIHLGNASRDDERAIKLRGFDSTCCCANCCANARCGD